MTLYDSTIPQLLKMLGNLKAWMQEAEAYAQERGFEVDVLVNARLCPDQFSFARQVQSSCDNVKFVAARLSDTEPPKNPDTEASFAELHARIDATVAFVEGIPAEAYAGAEGKELFLPFLRGASVMSEDYVFEFVLPNTYFHLTSAYSILRHNGVKLGKRAYLGHMNIRPPKEG